MPRSLGAALQREQVPAPPKPPAVLYLDILARAWVWARKHRDKKRKVEEHAARRETGHREVPRLASGRRLLRLRVKRSSKAWKALRPTW